ncbi:hypothetical protein [Methanosarcina horonobensis]|uniref:hypothetical protein n=1 Tax=Methanosarcina horonobensis TaxID=418008 RepID=UPI00138E1A7D|nr:hypothetical protein [Methanosarcina horonobensis]
MAKPQLNLFDFLTIIWKVISVLRFLGSVSDKEINPEEQTLTAIKYDKSKLLATLTSLCSRIEGQIPEINSYCKGYFQE